MKYTTLGFVLHRRCNASCKICCFESNPSATEVLDVNRIKSYIDETSDIGDITTISFTGGEPFLAYETLLDLVAYTTKLKKKTTAVTNGFWAENYDKCYEMLFALKSNGLSHFSVSHDFYHKEFVNTENVKNILKATLKLGIPTTIGMVKVKGENVGNLINELGSSLYGSSVQIVPCLPAGNAIKSFQDTQFDRTISTKNVHCMYGGNLVVSYDGMIYPCCSQPVVETGLGVGNFVDMTLKEALSKIKNNAILYFLRNENMDFFTDYYTKNNLGDPIPDYVVNQCELCPLLFKEESLSSFYPLISEAIARKKSTV